MYTFSWDKAYLCARRGDAPAPAGKPKQQGTFDGMGGPVVDPHNEGWTELPVASDFFLSEVVVIETERSMLPTLMAAIAQVNQPAIINEETGETEPLSTGYRFTAKFLDWDVLEPYVVAQCPDFKDRLYRKEKIPVLKVPFFPLAALKDSTTIDVYRDPSVRPEVGALLPGNYTVGVAGAYLTFGGAAGSYAANNAGGAMAGNVTMTEISNIVEVAQALATQALGGFTWLTTSDNPHYGDPTAGWLLSINHNTPMFALQQDNSGIMEVEHLYTRWVSAANANNICFRVQLCAVAAGTQYINLHDLLLDGNGKRGEVGFDILNTAVADRRVWNSVVWDYDLRGIRTNAGANPLVVENNAVYLCDSVGAAGYGLGNAAGTFRNNTGYDNTTDFVAIGGAVIGRYNRSSDATAADINWGGGGVGNTINAVVLNDVQSVNDAQAIFFDIIVGGLLDSAGEANTGPRLAWALCNHNRPVPNHLGFTSVGPAEIPEPVVPPVPEPTEERRHVRQYVFRMTATGCRS